MIMIPCLSKGLFMVHQIIWLRHFCWFGYKTRIMFVSIVMLCSIPDKQIEEYKVFQDVAALNKIESFGTCSEDEEVTDIFLQLSAQSCKDVEGEDKNDVPGCQMS
ncbi:uncharacterized protein LOC108218253 [Daucus carota subsp. sativus]|uniref:uncharacterized protein LOC108218253 n=1 Tax=Daucus carota subsp. sativus TaxID=79200 RepID=UPI0007EF3A6D|nr:PREDICTED: uncharacterized protein LOC108218253 [Daucus carota subsp. sativus]